MHSLPKIIKEKLTNRSKGRQKGQVKRVTLSYIDLLSPQPFMLQNIGGVVCPTLRQVQQIGYDTYQLYLSIILMTPQSYFSMLPTDGSMEETSVYELITGNSKLCLLAERALNFFLTGSVRFSPEYQCFFLYEKEPGEHVEQKPDGLIHRELWQPLCQIIAQRNYVEYPAASTLQVKSQKAKKRLERLEKLRPKHRKVDHNMDIGNIISAVAGKSPSLNLINIWDMTIYQLWDTFYRLCNNHILNIQSMSVAAWGDQNHSFDSSSWYKNLREH